MANDDDEDDDEDDDDVDLFGSDEEDEDTKREKEEKRQKALAEYNAKKAAKPKAAAKVSCMHSCTLDECSLLSIASVYRHS